jgi:hypothetical protein
LSLQIRCVYNYIASLCFFPTVSLHSFSSSK